MGLVGADLEHAEQAIRTSLERVGNAQDRVHVPRLGGTRHPIHGFARDQELTFDVLILRSDHQGKCAHLVNVSVRNEVCLRPAVKSRHPELLSLAFGFLMES